MCDRHFLHIFETLWNLKFTYNRLTNSIPIHSTDIRTVNTSTSVEYVTPVRSIIISPIKDR